MGTVYKAIEVGCAHSQTEASGEKYVPDFDAGGIQCSPLMPLGLHPFPVHLRSILAIGTLSVLMKESVQPFDARMKRCETQSIWKSWIPTWKSS